MKFFYLKTIRQNGTAHQVALGMAWGVFLGLMTPPGPQMVIAFITATLLGFNRITSVLGVWISNPITFPIMYPAEVWLGSTICGLTINYRVPNNLQDFMLLLKDYDTHWDVLISLTVGASVFTAVFTPLSYYLTRFCVMRYRANRAKRRAQIRKRVFSSLQSGRQPERETTG